MPGGIVGKGRGHMVELGGVDLETGVAHAQRAKDALLQRLCQRHAVQRLDHQAQHVGGVAVAESAARLGHQRQRRQRRQEARPVDPGAARGQRGLRPQRPGGSVWNLLRVGQA